MKQHLKKIIIKLNLVYILSIPLLLFRIFPIKKNRILFVNFSGKGYGDSPKYIADIFLRDKKEYEMFWVLKKGLKNDIPSGIEAIQKYSIRYFYLLATSRVIVSNVRLDQYILKRKKQRYIQTWHGCLPIKKIEYDIADKLPDYYRKVMKNDNKNIDVMISNSDFCTELYRRAFKFNGRIEEYGTPRNDCFINDIDKLSKKARAYLKDESTRYVLYAPTFRNNYENNPYDIDYELLTKTLEEKTHKKWKVLLRLHPSVKNCQSIIKPNSYVINMTDYSDMQELLCACDILITDYSSTMFEGMIAEKSVLLYAKDIEEYADERGYYFDFAELPFPLAKNNNELIDIIKNNDLNGMKDNYNSFKKRLGLVENGTASQKVCELISSYIDGVDDE